MTHCKLVLAGEFQHSDALERPTTKLYVTDVHFLDELIHLVCKPDSEDTCHDYYPLIFTGKIRLIAQDDDPSHEKRIFNLMTLRTNLIFIKEFQLGGFMAARGLVTYLHSLFFPGQRMSFLPDVKTLRCKELPSFVSIRSILEMRYEQCMFCGLDTNDYDTWCQTCKTLFSNDNIVADLSHRIQSTTTRMTRRTRTFGHLGLEFLLFKEIIMYHQWWFAGDDVFLACVRDRYMTVWVLTNLFTHDILVFCKLIASQEDQDRHLRYVSPPLNIGSDSVSQYTLRSFLTYGVICTFKHQAEDQILVCNSNLEKTRKIILRSFEKTIFDKVGKAIGDIRDRGRCYIPGISKLPFDTKINDTIETWRKMNNSFRDQMGAGDYQMERLMRYKSVSSSSCLNVIF